MKARKQKSHRTPVRLRHKIEKASAAKQRKQRKQAKKDPTWRSRVKKDPGIPNLFPYKERILLEVRDQKQKRADATQNINDNVMDMSNDVLANDVTMNDASRDNPAVDEDLENESLLDYEDSDAEDNGVSQDANPMAALLASAKARASKHNASRQNTTQQPEESASPEPDMSTDEEEHAPAKQSHNRTSQNLQAAFNSVVSDSDVLLHVLDVRDPEGTRSRSVEASVLANPEKRLILILNKIDLVPSSVLQGWLRFYRSSFLTLPLLATKSAAYGSHTYNHGKLSSQNTANALFQALKGYAAKQKAKRSINVGVIGYPNVGKSSVINALASKLGGNRTPCAAGAEAGVTRGPQKVKLDSKLCLLDSPGIISRESRNHPSTSTSRLRTEGSKIPASSDEHARLILLNAIPPRDIDDPIPAVSLLLDRIKLNDELYESVLKVYDLPPLMSDEHGNTNTTDFLVQVARKRGRLGRGGVPNLHAAALTILGDWRDGRIRAWEEPPAMGAKTLADSNLNKNGSSESRATRPDTNDQKTLVTQWAAEFKLDDLLGDLEGIEDST